MASPADQDTFARAVEAAKAHDLDVLRELVSADAGLLHQRDHEEHSLLDHATWDLLVGDWSRPPTIEPDPEGRGMAAVRYLLDAGADVNGRGQHGWTPLHTALYENHVELTEELLARGADAEVEVYAAGGTPLLQALFWGHAAAADALAAHTITPRNLRVAAGLGRADLIEEMFDGAELRPAAFAKRGYYRPHDGMPEWTPGDDPQEVLDEAFTYAVRNARDGVLEDLLDRGARVDAVPYGGGALHFAASTGGPEILAWLLDRGADPSLRSGFGAQDGVTPLHVCAWLDRADMARTLVERGADATLRDGTHDGDPLGWAEFMGSERAAAYLRSIR